MADSSGTILATLESSTAVVRVRGRAQAHQCPAFRRFAEDALNGRAARLQVDLSECEYFDSTFLGIIHDLSEEEHLKQQMIQSQKLQSLGTLASGWRRGCIVPLAVATSRQHEGPDTQQCRDDAMPSICGPVS